MAGVNPYIAEQVFELPTKPYRVRFEPMGKTLDIKPDDLADPMTGAPGSILAIAELHHIDIDHSCGGVVACSTCHIYVKEGLSTCNEASEDEEDMLDMAPGLTAQSRLACQVVPNGTQDVVIEIPEWNRNQVKENH